MDLKNIKQGSFTKSGEPLVEYEDDKNTANNLRFHKIKNLKQSVLKSRLNGFNRQLLHAFENKNCIFYSAAIGTSPKLNSILFSRMF